MDKNGFLVIFFTFLIFTNTSNASIALNFWKFIRLASSGNNSTASQPQQVSPMPSPAIGGEKGLSNNNTSSNSSVSGSTLNVEKPKEGQGVNNTSGRVSDNDDASKKKRVDGTTNTTDASAQPPPPPGGTTKNSSDEMKEKTKKGNGSSDDKSTSTLQMDSCEGASNVCKDQGAMVACIQHPKTGGKQLFMVVQNEGEKPLKVNVNVLPSTDNSPPAFEVSEHKTKKIDLSFAFGKTVTVVLDAGSGNCELHLVNSPVSVDKFLEQLSFYSKQVTPIYGAYFSFLVALVFGGTWACCKLRKGRRDGGVPYQELEMGLPESTSAVNVEAAEGWDQDWDDDWDEDSAVKSPGSSRVGNISANGLTSRSSKRDGWEVDWDD